MRYVAAIAVIVVLMISVLPTVVADSDTEVLFDEGNGVTSWSSGNGTTVLNTVVLAGSAIGYEVDYNKEILVNGVGSVTIGGEDTGGSLTESGTTGITVVTGWHLFAWTDGAWTEADADAKSDYDYLALAYYPEGTVPAETPLSRNAWTMFRGDSLNSGSQEAVFSSSETYSTVWYEKGSGYANPLYAHGNVYMKFGLTYPSDGTKEARVVCTGLETGTELWSFSYASIMNYESTTPVIVGDYIYVATALGAIYRIPLDEGPGENDENVVSIENVPSYIEDFEGYTYDSGFVSPVAYAGIIYLTHSNGMVYCFDLDLNLVWSYLMKGHSYLSSPTVTDGYVYAGALNGHLYVIDAFSGEEIVDENVYQVTKLDKNYGGIGQINVFGDGDQKTLIFTVSDGMGMSQTRSGIAVYAFDIDEREMTQIFLNDEMGTFGRYSSPVETDGFTGVLVACSDGSYTNILRVSTDGEVSVLIEGLATIHSAGLVVNGEWIVFVSYSAGDPIYVISLEGEIVGTAKCPAEVRNFNMSCPVIAGDYLVAANDSGVYVLYGLFEAYEEEEFSQGSPVIVYLGIFVLAAMLVLVAVWVAIRYRTGEDRPFAYLKGRFLYYLYGEELRHNTRSRHRLRFMVIVGAVLIFLSFTLCISIGSTDAMNPIDAYAYMFSAISKGGVGLDLNETLVFVSRLPRTIAAAAVGIGLAIAGSVYQAIIRNPLVDPYIMGVSSGAGIAAIAVIAFDFTFFGIFSPHSIFLTAISAMIGGLIAFACTMIIAEKAGGSSINYVLAGVVVGLAFSALQTIMLTMSGNKLSNALTWLYGSFAEVTWSQVGVVFFLSVFLSAATLFWAKEFNLVLLGEDQAREMGLNVRRFNRAMLILASVLTSVCVAFCGIIGFVGLVIPHLCRMVLGSDHRMVLPASMLLGPVMLMLADLLARTGYYGIELPVGAITTVIGIPVFAYLLIKKGRIYDG